MQPLVSLHTLSKRFAQKTGIFGKEQAFYAVRDISMQVMAGKTLGIVGESGSGKSTLGRMAVGLLEPSFGEVRMHGMPFVGADCSSQNTSKIPKSNPTNSSTAWKAQQKECHELFRGKIQMIFQDPYSSLNPRMRIGTAVGEPLLYTEPNLSKKEREVRVQESLQQVGLGFEQAGRYPHEFSGGQRQRIAVARALITQPEFVVCDEPTSSLDASVQAQVLNLLKDIQDARQLAYMFISHDLAVVRHMADRAAVMYQGLVVEEATVADLFNNALHPYTCLLLLDACRTKESGQEQDARTEIKKLNPLEAEDNAQLQAESKPWQPGMTPFCPFYSRCPRRIPKCINTPIDLLPVGHKSAEQNTNLWQQEAHLVRCHCPR